MAAKPIPLGYHRLTPYLIVRGVLKAIECYERAFGAQRIKVHFMPDGQSVMHAEIQLGDSRLFLTEENEQWGSKSPLTLGGCASSLHLFVEDVDADFARAVEAGCTVKMPVGDMFWGDRFGQVTDPFGHQWSLASRLEDLTDEEQARRGEAFFAQMQPPQG